MKLTSAQRTQIKRSREGAAMIRAANRIHFDKVKARKAANLAARNAYRAAIGLPPATT